MYRKLTGRRRTLLGYSQLWLAPDHLLLVKSTRIAEQYQRFALADIQALTITRSSSRIPFQIAAALAAIAWTLAALAVHLIWAKYFFVITGAAALAAVIVDMLRGPACRCHLTTAVSREWLRPVSRIRAAQSFLGVIRPAIEAVQGTLASPEEVPVVQSAGGPVNPPEVPESRTHLPEVVFALFLVDAVVILAALRFPRTQMESVLPTTFFAEIVLVIVALLRRGDRDPRRVIYVLMMLAILGLGWDAVVVGRNVAAWFRLLVTSGRQMDPALLMSQLPWRQGAVTGAIWRAAAGAAGLAAAFLERGTR